MRERTIIILATAAAAVAAAANQTNVDEFNRQYSPLQCAITGECECPQAGKPACAKCPYDISSEWKNDKVCICKGLPTGSGIECSAGREFSPKKVRVGGNPGGPVSGTEGSFSAVETDLEDEKKSLAVSSVVGISLSALAVLLLGCLGGWMLIGRGRKNNDNSVENDGPGTRSMGSGDTTLYVSGEMIPRAEAEAVYIDFPSPGEAVLTNALPPTPGFMQKDYVNFTPPPVCEGLSAMIDSAGVGMQSAFLEAGTPPPQEIRWDEVREEDTLATTVNLWTTDESTKSPSSCLGTESGWNSLATTFESGCSARSRETVVTPPPEYSSTIGEILATTVYLGTTGGTEGTRSTVQYLRSPVVVKR